MEVSQLEELVQLLQNSSVGELTLRQGSDRVTLRKPPRVANNVERVVSLAHDDGVTPTPQSPSNGEIAPVNPPITIHASLVGIFGHLKPIVGLNANVKNGQQIGTISALGINTEIKATAAGVVTNLFVEDGQPVEYGQPIFEIQPN